MHAPNMLRSQGPDRPILSIDDRAPPWKRVKWKSLFFDCLLFTCMAIVYLTVNAAGARIVIPKLGTKLYKTALVSLFGLSKYRIFHELDLAPCFALFILVLVFLSSTTAIRVVVCGTPEKGHNSPLRGKIAVVAAATLILFDTILFWKGLMQQSFFEDSGRFTALAVAVGYSIALLDAAYLHVTLKERDLS